MNDSRISFYAALTLQMRTPLARIELAASQLEREDGTPAARGLAAGIGEAVGDLDRMITQLLGALVSPALGKDAGGKLDDVILALHDRLAPVLAARGVRWDSPESTPKAFGDPDVLRVAALAVLRAGAEWAGPGGWLSLQIQEDEQYYGLRLECGAVEACAVQSRVEGSLQELESRILAQGGAIEAECSGALCAANIWLGARRAACEMS
jgi:signal transduction histidine kinase